MTKKRVRQIDFLGAPARWLRYAREHGPVTIVDEGGKVRAILSVPGARIRVRDPR